MLGFFLPAEFTKPLQFLTPARLYVMMDGTK